MNCIEMLLILTLMKHWSILISKEVENQSRIDSRALAIIQNGLNFNLDWLLILDLFFCDYVILGKSQSLS